jgi:tRNA G10  N-methylase Trm11
MKIDIDPQQEGVVKASSVDVPVPDGMLSSIIFDPPFLTYIKSGREHNSVMAKRFGGYWRYDELVEHYTKTISEAHRLLVKNGIFVVKCQDIIHNHKLHPTHINITNWCSGIFRLKDFFVLPAENRMPMPESKTGVKRVQKHSRIHHSYFMVFEKI